MYFYEGSIKVGIKYCDVNSGKGEPIRTVRISVIGSGWGVVEWMKSSEILGQ